jgi:hypothetical protein
VVLDDWVQSRSIIGIANMSSSPDAHYPLVIK